MHKTQMNFIESILEIKDHKSAMKYHYFEPKDWKAMLGKHLFMRYMKLIADLIIIWNLTLGKMTPIPYKNYYDMKDRSYGYIICELEQQLEMAPEEPSTPPAMTDQPPPYTRVSPMVQQFQREHDQSYRQRHGNETSRHTYRTTRPNPIDSVVSFPIPMADAVEAQETESVRSYTSRFSKKTKKDSDSQEEWPDEAYVSLDPTDMKSRKWSSNESTSHAFDRKNRANAAKIRPKFKKITWNGMSSTFRAFGAALEGHLMQVGAGYLIDKIFLEIYKKLGTEHL